MAPVSAAARTHLPVHYNTARVIDLDVFYREAGPHDAQAVLLLWPERRARGRRFRRRPTRPRPRKHGPLVLTMLSISLRKVSLMASLASREAAAWMLSSRASAVC